MQQSKQKIEPFSKFSQPFSFPPFFYSINNYTIFSRFVNIIRFFGYINLSMVHIRRIVMNKTILFFIISGLLVSVLSGCGKENPNTTPKDNQAVQVRTN